MHISIHTLRRYQNALWLMLEILGMQSAIDIPHSWNTELLAKWHERNIKLKCGKRRKWFFPTVLKTILKYLTDDACTIFFVDLWIFFNENKGLFIFHLIEKRKALRLRNNERILIRKTFVFGWMALDSVHIIKYLRKQCTVKSAQSPDCPMFPLIFCSEFETKKLFHAAREEFDFMLRRCHSAHRIESGKLVAFNDRLRQPKVQRFPVEGDGNLLAMDQCFA